MEDFDKVSASVLADNFTKIDARFGQVANDLTTSESGWVLDARQGKALAKLVDDTAKSLNTTINQKLPTANVVNNLTTTAGGYALDARQGKALNEKINGKTSKSAVTVSLAVASWSGSGPYTQTVSASGVTASNVVVVSPAPASFIVWGECGVRATAQSAGKLTFTAESKPEAALSASVLCLN